MKKFFILIVISLFLFLPQGAKAGTASKIADKTIEFTAKTAYYVTKYALKGGWFITRKTAHGIKIITISVFSAAKDAFGNDRPGQPERIPHQHYEENNTLPPPPPILD